MSLDADVKNLRSSYHDRLDTGTCYRETQHSPFLPFASDIFSGLASRLRKLGRPQWVGHVIKVPHPAEWEPHSPTLIPAGSEEADRRWEKSDKVIEDNRKLVRAISGRPGFRPCRPNRSALDTEQSGN